MEVELNEEVVTNEKTGGQKGQKTLRYDLIPVKPLRQLAYLYGVGAKKYEPNNWRKGYNWSLSMAALERHYQLWKEGELFDQDGFQHLAAVVFHAFALMEFQVTHPELDDRFKEQI